MDRRLWLIPIGLALLLVAAVVVVFGPRLLGGRGTAALQSIPAFSGTAESGGILGETEGLPEPGETAPDFALPDLAGETVRLSDLRGRPVVLNFWATWCAPCRIEMPMLEQAAADGGDDLAVLVINQGETAEQVGAFFDDVGLSLPALLDSDGEVGRAYGAVYLPSTFIIGPDGIVSAVHHGILSREELDGYLAALAETGQ